MLFRRAASKGLPCPAEVANHLTYVESTSMMLIQSHNNVVCPVGYQGLICLCSFVFWDAVLIKVSDLQYNISFVSSRLHYAILEDDINEHIMYSTFTKI